jgi:hypothetical protein
VFLSLQSLGFPKDYGARDLAICFTLIATQNLYSSTLSHLVIKGINQSLDILHDLFDIHMFVC